MHLFRRIARVWLHVVGCATPNEIVADLGEEAARRRLAGWNRFRTLIWAIRELMIVSLYEWRDRMRTASPHNPPPTKPSKRPRPKIWLAMKLAVRSVRREPLSAVTGALVLAVGFGAAAAIYSVLLGFNRPLPVPNGQDVVRVQILRPNQSTVPLTIGHLTQVQQTGAFSVISGFTTSQVAVGTEGFAARMVTRGEVGPGVFDVLGALPVAGRVPSGTEAEPAAVVGAGLANQWYPNPSDVLGTTITIDDLPHTVVGVMPTTFRFPFNEQLWTTLPPNATEPIELVGRLAPGTSGRVAESSLTSVIHAIQTEQSSSVDARVRVMGFTEGRGEGGENAGLTAALLVVLALVLVSCANVSNIQLARGASRTRVYALHKAMGATPLQIKVQTLFESATISGAGALGGLAIAFIMSGQIERHLGPHWGYHWMRVSLDPQVALFMLGLGVATAVLSGTFPAITSSHAAPSETLKQGGHALGHGIGTPGRVLLGAQVTFSFVIMVLASLLATSSFATRRISQALDAHSILVGNYTFTSPRFADPQERERYGNELLKQLEDTPAIEAVAFATGIPGFRAPFGELDVDGTSVVDSVGRPARVSVNAVTPAFFEIFGMTTLSGRTLRAEDKFGAVAVVDDAFSRTFLDGADPLGRSVRVLVTATDTTVFRVVGVVSDETIYNEVLRPTAHVYIPASTPRTGSTYIIARTSTPGTEARSLLSQAGSQVDPTVPITATFSEESSATLAEVLSYLLRLPRAAALLVSMAALGGLLVAAIGVYGLLAFDVQQRIRQVGIKIALGATRERILRDVLLRGISSVAPGVAIGTVIAFIGSAALGTLAGDSLRDPRIYLTLVIVYGLVAAAATAIPAGRAARVSPLNLLRDE